jgi:hypothetical protein
MADININKFRTSVVREGSRPASAGFVESEGQDPVDPAGSTQNHLPVTIAPAADGLSITDSQVLGGAGTTSQYLRGDGSLATFPALTGFVPYTGATADVNLGTHDLTAERGTFENNGSSDTLTVNHTSGSGKGINVSKGGNGEALLVTKTSGSGNAMAVVGGRTSLVDLSLSSVSNATGNFLTISGGVVHQRTPSETRSDVGAQAQLNGTGFVKASGTTITYDNSTYQVTSEKAQPNGYASLDSNGKVPLVQINDALIGNVNFQGLWNAATNTPTLANPPASGTKGYYYIVSTAGTFASISFEVGDWIISNGTAWGKVDNTDAVSSVFGRTGNVTATNGDYNTSQVTENTNLYYTEARVNANTNVAANTAARHNAVTLGTANGLSLSTQVLSLQLATSGQNGALSSTDWNTFNSKENAITAGTTAQYYRGDKTFQTLNTGVVPESGNLYFTNARAIASVLTGYTSGAGTISAADTILSAIQKLNGNIGALTTGVSSVNGQTGVVVLTTTNIAEGTNLYYTEARVNANTNVAANTAARHAAVTLGTANGLSLNVQQLSLGLASAGVTGALSGTDWSTFNSKQQALNGTGFVKISGTTISYDNSTYLTTAAAASTYLALAGGTMTGDVNWAQTDRGITWGFNTDGASIKFYNTGDGDTNSRLEFATLDNNDEFFRWVHIPSGGSLYESMRLVPNSNGNAQLIVSGSIIKSGGTSSQFLKADGSVDSNSYYLASNPSAFIALTALSGTAPIQYNNTTGAISITQASGSTNGFLSSTDWNTFNNKTSNVGTVTSVAALTLGTTGTDLSSTVANGTTTPVITLNVPTASAANRGALSAADWTTFNSKENAITAGTTAQYYRGDKTFQTLNTAAVPESGNLYYTEARVNANTNVAANTAARHNAVTLGTANGLSLSTQELSLGLASSSANGALSSTDWTTFNNKQNALTNPVTGTGTTNYLPKFTGASTIGNSQVFDAATGVGIGTTSVDSKLTVNGQVRVSDLTLQGFYQARTSDTAGAGVFGGNSFVLRNGATSEDLCFDVFNRSTSVWYTPLIIKNTGNVGIGTTIPTDKFQMNGGKAIFATSNFNGTTAGGSVFVFSDDNNGGKIWAQKNGNSDWGYLALQPLGGNVLIGTSTSIGPSILQVTGDARISNVLLAGGAANIDSSLAVQISTTGSGTQKWFGANKNGSYGLIVGYSETTGLSGVGAYIRQVTSDPLFFVVNNVTTALTLASTGAATFSSSVTATSYSLGAGNGRFQTSGFWGTLITAGTGSFANFAVIDSATNGIMYNPTGTLNMSFAGSVGIGTAVSNNTLNIYNDNNAGISLQSSFTGTTANDGFYIGQLFQSTNFLFRQRENADIIFETNNGSERMRITSAGNVGIGTASPDEILRINGYSNGSSRLRLFNQGTELGALGSYSGYIGSGNANDLLLITPNNLAFAAGSTERMRIASGGNVLINKTSDNGTKFQVNGALWSNEGLYLEGTDAFIWQLANSSLRFATNSTERMRITSGGNVGIGTTPSAFTGYTNLELANSSGSVLTLRNNANTAQFAIETDINGTVFRNTSNTGMAFLTNNNIRMVISSGGNIAINESLTTDILRVGGNTFTNTITTLAPTGNSNPTWRLGASRGGTVTTNATVRVEIDGVLVDLVARYV